VIRRVMKVGLMNLGSLLPRRVYAGLSIMPALHVERLHIANVFAELEQFCCQYQELTGKKALLTVITPRSPLLSRALADCGVSQDQYAGYIRQLASRADIGLHGHYLRGSEMGSGPCHCYWADRSTVQQQLKDEFRWLSDRNLLTVPAYAGGWWYLDGAVVSALEEAGIKYDFTMSARPYSQSTFARRMMRANNRPGQVTRMSEKLTGLWALQGLESASVSNSAWRFIAAAQTAALAKNGRTLFTLYGHDWDLNCRAAIASLSWCRDRGIRFFECADLPGLAVSEKPPIEPK